MVTDTNQSNPGRRSIVAIQEYHLRHGVLQLHRLEPSPQPNHVSGMGYTMPGPGLSSLHWYESGLHQPGENAIGWNEGVGRAGPFVRRLREDRRRPPTDIFEGQGAGESIGMSREPNIH